MSLNSLVPDPFKIAEKEFVNVDNAVNILRNQGKQIPRELNNIFSRKRDALSLALMKKYNGNFQLIVFEEGFDPGKAYSRDQKVKVLEQLKQRIEELTKESENATTQRMLRVLTYKVNVLNDYSSLLRNDIVLEQ